MTTTTETKPDVLITDRGSIIVLTPCNGDARDWIDCNVNHEPHNWQGGNLCVEHRCADVIIDAMQNDDLTVKSE